MIEFCKIHNVVYTRYADDLTFSSKKLTKEEEEEILGYGPDGV
jgi:hypothetical protein